MTLSLPARFRWPRGAVALALILGAAPLVAAVNDISLARLAPPERLREILLPVEPWRPFPPIADRAAWAALPAATRTLLTQRGEEAGGQSLPALPATLFLEYARAGNRSRYEAVHRTRRELLHALVLAECVEDRGRFLDAIGNAVWSLCEESAWCYPAHLAPQGEPVGLPDAAQPIVDLHAGETAVALAWTRYLLGPKLDAVSPQLGRRIAGEIQRRILDPVLAREFTWMGFNEKSYRGRPNNWNPWVNASVLTAALLVETDLERRVKVVDQCLRSLDRFLQPYPSDGSCDEGPGYWGHAGGSVLDCLELLHGATAGRIDAFSHPLIQDMGRFIYRAHIAADWFVNIGDGAPRLEFDRALVFRYGQRIGDPQLQSLAAAGATPESIVDSAGGRYLGRQLRALFHSTAVLAFRPASPPLVRDVWLGSEDMQLMTARSRAGSTAGWFVAAWGGHNAQSHNHNDVGNVIVFADGQPVLVDVGAPTYTAQTFSNQRYQIWAFQSAFHNLPTINGTMQASGRERAARAVSHQATDAFAEFSLDLAGAYPESARVKSWRRTVRIERAGDLRIAERFELAEIGGATTGNFVTPMNVVVATPGVLRLTSRPGSESPPITLRFTFDPAKLAVRVERVELDDARLKKTWAEQLNRIVVQALTPATSDTWTLQLSRESQ